MILYGPALFAGATRPQTHFFSFVGTMISPDKLALDNGLAYSYRTDERVPSFPDDKPLIVFDGVCIFCSGFAKFVLRHDRHNRFNLCTAQSALGRALYIHYGLDPDNYETNIVIREGQAHFKSDAFFEVMRSLGAAWPLLTCLRIFPRAPRNWFYDRMAKNRYKLFGKAESCILLPPEHRTKILDHL